MAWFSGPESSSRYSSRHSPSRYSSHQYSTSRYRRRPRDGYFERILYKTKGYIRNFYNYARRHPARVFMLVVMPLITSGALTILLKKLGIRLPPGISRMISSFGEGRKEYRDRKPGELSDLAGGGGIQGIMRIAQMFI